MSWINRVRKAVPFLATKETTAETLWHKCPSCTEMIFIKEWEDNLNVCPRCDYHDRIGWRTRFEQLFDEGEYELLPTPEVREDPLRFDVGRANAREHIAFSAGRHHCLGAQLARMEGEVGLRALFDRFPDPRLDGPPHRRPLRVLRGYDAMPARLTRATVDA